MGQGVWVVAGVQYGVEILISDAMHERVKEEFLCRRIDRVVAVGKSKPTDIWELVAHRTLATPDQVPLFLPLSPTLSACPSPSRPRLSHTPLPLPLPLPLRLPPLSLFMAGREQWVCGRVWDGAELRGVQEDFCGSFGAILVLYRQRSFQHAQELFAAYRDKWTGDKAASVYYDRCSLMIDDPPNSDWQATFYHKEK